MLKDENGKPIFSFTNILALTTIIFCMIFLFVAAFALGKSESRDNAMLSQINTGILINIGIILAYYFGSSSASAKQAQQITEMQAAAIGVANGNNTTAATTNNNTDKAIKIGELKKALENLEPDSEDAKKILTELTELEKNTL